MSMFALKLAQSAGMRVVLTSSSDEKLERISRQFASPSLVTVNYAKNPEWHEEVLRLTDGVGVDLVVEVGGLFVPGQEHHVHPARWHSQRGRLSQQEGS